jgi:hypothetical protein
MSDWWLYRLMLVVETYGGQSCILFLLYLTTIATAALDIRETDLTKQAFAAMIGFLTGNALAKARRT